ncbi:MAG: hypothetical protein AAF550_07345 [Myxococcota bacterium]
MEHPSYLSEEQASEELGADEVGTGWQGILSQWQRRKVHLKLWLWLDGVRQSDTIRIRASLHREPADAEVERYESLGMASSGPYQWTAEVDRIRLLRLVQEPAVRHVEIDSVFSTATSVVGKGASSGM